MQIALKVFLSLCTHFYGKKHNYLDDEEDELTLFSTAMSQIIYHLHLNEEK